MARLTVLLVAAPSVILVGHFVKGIRSLFWALGSGLAVCGASRLREGHSLSLARKVNLSYDLRLEQRASVLFT